MQYYIQYYHLSLLTYSNRELHTSYTVEVNEHVVGEATALVGVDVLLSDIQSAGRSAHAQVPYIRHVATQLSILTATVLLTVRTPTSMALHLQPSPDNLDDSVPRTLGTHNRGPKAAPACISSLRCR